MKAIVLACAMTMVLSGCAIGIKEGDTSPSITYTIPRHYQLVYLRAENQAIECLRGKQGNYDVHADVDPVLQTGVVFVRSPVGAGEVARTDLAAIDPQHTRVTHTVWGVSPWDAKALRAMKESIVMDTSMCVAYR